MSSGTSGTSRTSRTSHTSLTAWSDDATEMPKETLSNGHDERRAEPPLIDFGSDEDQANRRSESWRDAPKGSPAAKLKSLLRQMDAEIREATPDETPRKSSIAVDGRSASWRDGRRQTGGTTEVVTEEAQGPVIDGREDTDIDDSPPTPPRRFGSRQFRSAPNGSLRDVTPPTRIPTRAAVLHASTSRPSQPVSPRQIHSPTPLETFITSHSGRASSRSVELASSTSSRKGKEKAQVADDSWSSLGGVSAGHSPLPRNDIQTSPARFPRQSASPRGADSTPTRDRRIPMKTPRRWSVDLAPEDPQSFEEGAHGLEIGEEVELDLDESSVEPPIWTESEQSEPEDGPAARIDRTLRARKTMGQDTSPSRFSLPHSPSRGNKLGAKDDSLPALPIPSESDTTDEEGALTLSARRAAMFRSPSKSSSQTPRSTSDRFSSVLSKLHSDPGTVQEGEVDDEATSRRQREQTPIQTFQDEVSLSKKKTPHPPGRWFSPARDRSSLPSSLNKPLPVDPADEVALLEGSPSPQSPAKMTLAAENPGNSSFLARLKNLSVTNSNPPPRPSTTLVDARNAIERAATNTKTARVQVERTQQDWLNAISAASRTGTVPIIAVKPPRGWTSLAWWLGMEVLLVWGVYRVTLDYAQSAAHLSAIDPFSLSANYPLSMTLPTAISTFVVPHRTSTNIFDFLGSADVLSKLYQLGFMSALPGVLGLSSMDGVRMLGGVPT